MIAVVIAVWAFYPTPVPPPTPAPERRSAGQADGEKQASETGAPGTVEVKLASGDTKRIVPGSGESFKDCAACPEMVIVPDGTFVMGSGDGETRLVTLDGSRGDVLPKEKRRDSDEGPPHEVRIPQPFAVGKFEITNAQYVAFLNDVKRRGTEKEPWFETKAEDSRSQITGSVGAFAVEAGKQNFPVVNVSWFGARAYAKWLSEKTGKIYRLLSEAEWEYAARAGTTGPFSFEGQITPDKANYHGRYTYAGSPKGEYRKKTVPVDSFEPNPWGLFQVHGNVWEWVEDCWNTSYSHKPANLAASGAAWTTGNCGRRVLRGGSWGDYPRALRSAYRIGYDRDDRYGSRGFRLARTLAP